MPLTKPIKTIRVDNFCDFCQVFEIETDLVAGDDGCDEELIEQQLQIRNNEKWFITFIDDRNLGYFLLHQFT